MGLNTLVAIFTSRLSTECEHNKMLSPGRGGLGMDPAKTALLFIEFQNEFTSEGGKLHPQVKEVMQMTGMLENASKLVGYVM